MAVIVPSLIAAGYSIYKGVEGNKKIKQAEQDRKNNPRPTYEINPEEYDNLALAESRAQQGLGDASKQAYLQNAQAGLTTSINNILKGGGDTNAVGQTYDAYLGNLSKMAIVDDQTKIANVQQLIAQRKNMSDQKDKVFQIDQYAPWADKAAAIAQLNTAGQNEMAGAAAGVIQSVGGIATGVQQDYQRSQVTNGNGQPYNAPSATTPATQGTPFENGRSFDGQYWAGLSSDDRNLLNNLYGI